MGISTTSQPRKGRHRSCAAPYGASAECQTKTTGSRPWLKFYRRYAAKMANLQPAVIDRIITGTDSGPSSGPANLAGLAMHVEMEALVDAGLTPMQAIQASTKWAAELLHQDRDLGTIAPGRIADIILIDGDPLADIRATRKIRTVTMNGK